MFGALRRAAGAVVIFNLVAAVGLAEPSLAQVEPPASANVAATAPTANLIAGPAADEPDAKMTISGSTRPPIGYLGFCRKFPAECKRHGDTRAVALSESLWTELVAVNRVINRQIAPVTDLEKYNVEELWTIPIDSGDCEDYVLLKRQALMRQGWPSGALLVTVVFDEIGDGHAVLIVRTDRGDFALDNKVDAIRIWSQTPYRYVKRQSISDPDRWVAVQDPRWPAGSLASSN